MGKGRTGGGGDALAEVDQADLVGDVHRGRGHVPAHRFYQQSTLASEEKSVPGDVVRLPLVPDRARVRVQHGRRVHVARLERRSGRELEEDPQEGEDEEEQGGGARAHYWVVKWVGRKRGGVGAWVARRCFAGDAWVRFVLFLYGIRYTKLL